MYPTEGFADGFYRIGAEFFGDGVLKGDVLPSYGKHQIKPKPLQLPLRLNTGT
jgi:hypothetical protein